MMTEPNRRTHHKAEAAGQGYAPAESYATEVLLIADAAEGGRYETRKAGGEAAEAEPLDMESVVRKLIALLSDQQP
jgi:hypothetical protein